MSAYRRNLVRTAKALAVTMALLVVSALPNAAYAQKKKNAKPPTAPAKPATRRFP